MSLLAAAKNLRKAQRQYLANRTEENGRIVGLAAEILDQEIAATEAELEEDRHG